MNEENPDLFAKNNLDGLRARNPYSPMSERFRLTELLETAKYQNDLLAQRCRELEKERDEARREVCRMVSDADERSKPESPEQIADRREWNCFNAPEHKLVKTLNGIITNKGKATPPQYLQDLG